VFTELPARAGAPLATRENTIAAPESARHVVLLVWLGAALNMTRSSGY
jgi:hypothetical protein